MAAATRARKEPAQLSASSLHSAGKGERMGLTFEGLDKLGELIILIIIFMVCYEAAGYIAREIIKKERKEKKEKGKKKNE